MLREIVALLAVVAPASCQTQEPVTIPPPAAQSGLFLTWNEVEKGIWAKAKPYIDFPTPELEKALPELKGMQPAASQEPLNGILTRTGETCVNLRRRTPNVISEEEVSTITRRGLVSQQKFEYLLISETTPEGFVLKEYRTTKKDKTARSASSEGYASMWIRFYPANQHQSRFRYLGEQVINQHKAYVVGFAQIPDAVKFPGEFFYQDTKISVLYQGVAWIDSSDFRILRMREDLLAPRPDAFLTKFTAATHFDEVHISQAASLWLPQEADVVWEFNGQVVLQRHAYSHYRLYAVETKVLPVEP